MELNLNINIDISDQELIEIFTSTGYEVLSIEDINYKKIDHGRFEEIAMNKPCVMINERKVELSHAFESLYMPRIKDAMNAAINDIVK